MPNITLENVQKRYGRRDQPAVQDLDLQIESGEFMCLLGPSGCGKTTTLRMIAGLEQLSSGQISIGQDVVDSVERGRFVPPEKRQLGLVFQSYALWPHLTVKENVEFGLKIKRTPRRERDTTVESVMGKLGISKYSSRYPMELSGGQQQRVALARMLAINPDVLLLDEPLSNLDARLRLEMRAELKRLHDQYDTTVMFVTHDQWEAMTLATKIAVMSEGELQQVGTPDEIYSAPANRFVAEFVGSPPINIIELQSNDSGPLADLLREHVNNTGTLKNRVASVGIRPESIHFGTERDAATTTMFKTDSEIIDILPTGGSWIIELNMHDTRILGITSHQPTLQTGDRINVMIHNSGLHCFDKDGNRVP